MDLMKFPEEAQTKNNVGSQERKEILTANKVVGVYVAINATGLNSLII